VFEVVPVLPVRQAGVALEEFLVVAEREREPALVVHLFLAVLLDEEQHLPQAGVEASSSPTRR